MLEEGQQEPEGLGLPGSEPRDGRPRPQGAGDRDAGEHGGAQSPLEVAGRVDPPICLASKGDDAQADEEAEQSAGAPGQPGGYATAAGWRRSRTGERHARWPELFRQAQLLDAVRERAEIARGGGIAATALRAGLRDPLQLETGGVDALQVRSLARVDVYAGESVGDPRCVVRSRGRSLDVDQARLLVDGRTGVSEKLIGGERRIAVEGAGSALGDAALVDLGRDLGEYVLDRLGARGVADPDDLLGKIGVVHLEQRSGLVIPRSQAGHRKGPCAEHRGADQRDPPELLQGGGKVPSPAARALFARLCHRPEEDRTERRCSVDPFSSRVSSSGNVDRGTLARSATLESSFRASGAE